MYTSETKEAVVVMSGDVARQLLRKGYRIIDIKADKKNKIKSVFVFENEGDFKDDFFNEIRRSNNFDKIFG